MSKKVAIRFANRTTGCPVEVHAEFEDTERSTLISFYEEAERLTQTRMISGGSSVTSG
jgi:hypothetical protein